MDDVFTNDYGGFISFDDDVCLYSGWDGEAPSDIESYEDED
jgi:hypothetical protein